MENLKELLKSPDVIKLFSLLGFNVEQNFTITNQLAVGAKAISLVPTSKLSRGVICDSSYGKLLIRSKPFNPYGVFKKIECVAVAPLLDSLVKDQEFIVIDNIHFVPRTATWNILTSDITKILGIIDPLKGFAQKDHFDISWIGCKAVSELYDRHIEVAHTLSDAMTLLIQVATNFTKFGSRHLHRLYNHYSWDKLLKGEASEVNFQVWDRGRNRHIWADDVTATEIESVETYLKQDITYTAEASAKSFRCSKTLRTSTFAEIEAWLKKEKTPELMTVYDMFPAIAEIKKEVV